MTIDNGPQIVDFVKGDHSMETPPKKSVFQKFLEKFKHSEAPSLKTFEMGKVENFGPGPVIGDSEPVSQPEPVDQSEDKLK